MGSSFFIAFLIVMSAFTHLRADSLRLAFIALCGEEGMTISAEHFRAAIMICTV